MMVARVSVRVSVCEYESNCPHGKRNNRMCWECHVAACQIAHLPTCLNDLLLSCLHGPRIGMTVVCCMHMRHMQTWSLVGLISLLDPPRPDSGETIKLAQVRCMGCLCFYASAL